MVYCMLDQEECHKFGNCKKCNKEGNNFNESFLVTKIVAKDEDCHFCDDGRVCREGKPCPEVI